MEIVDIAKQGRLLNPVPPIDRIPINVEGSLSKGPDGRPWVVLKFSEGLQSHTMAMPPATAESLIDAVTEVIHKLLAAVPTVGSGLLLPTPAPAGGGVSVGLVQGMPPR